MQVRFLSSAVMGGMIIHPAFFIAVLPWGIFRLTAYGGPKWAGGQQGRFQPIVFVLIWQYPGRAEQAGRGCAWCAFSLFNSHERCLCTIDGFAQHTYSFFIKSYNSTWILPRGYGTMKSDKNLTYVVCARGFFSGPQRQFVRFPDYIIAFDRENAGGTVRSFAHPAFIRLLLKPLCLCRRNENGSKSCN